MKDSNFGVQRSAFDVQRSASTDAARPWLGLASYTEETRDFFFGRADEVAELARRVQRKLLTVLFGQSGLGKTSILRAGLVPKLRPEGFCPIYVRLDHSPFAPPATEQIKSAVRRASDGIGTWSQSDTAHEGESLWEFFHHRDNVLNAPDGRVLTPLLIFDQFEEIFTLAQTDDAGRARAQAFLRELADLVENRAPTAIEDDEAAAERFDFARADYRLLIALREDYLAHLEGLRDLMPSVTQNRVRLTRMAGGPALEAVLRPGAGLVNDDVARQIVRFVSGASDLATAEVEPSLLSLVCRELNEMRLAQGRPEISADLLEGSRESILNEFYERSLADQPEAIRRFIEDELLTDSGFRESLAEERAQKVCAEAGAPNALTTLVDRRLLRIEERLDVRRVELTHDVLCSVVKARRDTRREREAREAAERRAAETEAREAATKKALWRARMIAAGCAVLAVAAIGSAIFGFVSLKEARAANTRAATARSQAEGLVGYMMEDLQPALEQHGQLRLLKHLAEQSVHYFESLPPEMRNVDTDRKMAAALMTLADVEDSMGDTVPAKAAFRRAVEMRARVAAAAPENATDQSALAAAQPGLVVWVEGDKTTNDEKLATYERTIATLAALHEKHPDNQDVLAFLAWTRMRGSWFFENTLGRPEPALPLMKQAHEDFQQLLTRDPDNRRYRRWNAQSLNTLSTVYDQLLDHDKALQLAKEAVDYLEQVLKEDPGNQVLMEASAQAAQNLSYRASVTDRQLSMDAERIARERFHTLSELDPDNRYYRNNYTWSFMMEAFGLETLGHTAVALTAFQRFQAELDARPEALAARRFDSTRGAQVCLDEARIGASLGQTDLARERIAEAHRRFAQRYPDANPQDPVFRRIHIFWMFSEGIEVAHLHDWPDLEKRSQALRDEIDAGLREAPNDPQLLIRRAEVEAQLGQALLKQGRLEEAHATLASAVAGFRDAPAVPQSVVWDRDDEAQATNAFWVELLTARGEKEAARSVAEAFLPRVEKTFSAETANWLHRQTHARWQVLLAGTLDATDSRRARLLDDAEALLKAGPADAQDTVDARAAFADIGRLRHEAVP